MSETTVTTCDMCNPEMNLVKVQDVQHPDFGLVQAPSGWIMAPFEFAEGWREVDYGHQCPKCAKEEDDQAAKDAAEDAYSFVGLELPNDSSEG